VGAFGCCSNRLSTLLYDLGFHLHHTLFIYELLPIYGNFTFTFLSVSFLKLGRQLYYVLLLSLKGSLATSDAKFCIVSLVGGSPHHVKSSM